MNLAFYGGLRWIVKSNVTERLSLSSPALSLRKQQGLGLLPALVVMSKLILQKKKKLLLLIYSVVNADIEEKTIKEPSLFLLQEADQPL